MGDTFNQNHSGIGDNIINFGKQPYRLSDQKLYEIAASIDRKKPVNFDLVGQAAIYYGNKLIDLMRNQDFTIGNISMTGTRIVMSFPPQPPVQNPALYEIIAEENSTLVFMDSNA